jgi:hypothetical protein
MKLGGRNSSSTFNGMAVLTNAEHAVIQDWIKKDRPWKLDSGDEVRGHWGSRWDGLDQADHVLVMQLGLKEDELSRLKAELRDARAGSVPDMGAFDDEEFGETEWLWDQRIPLGMLSMIVGHPGEGKSQLVSYIAAGVTNGWSGFEQGFVMMFSPEDSKKSMVGPRLKAAGAVLDFVKPPPEDMDISLPDDVDVLETWIERYGAKLVVFDTLDAHLSGSVDTHNNHSMRKGLNPVHRLADRTGCAILFTHHFNKSSDARAIYRVGGSIAYTAVVRSSMVLGKHHTADPQDDDRLLVHLKSNAARPPASLDMQIEDAAVEGRSRLPIATSRIVSLGASEATEEDIFGQPGRAGAQKDRAPRDFLELKLGDFEEHDATEVIDACVAETGCSDRTVQRAANDLDVIKKPAAPGRSATWRLKNPFLEAREGQSKQNAGQVHTP